MGYTKLSSPGATKARGERSNTLADADAETSREARSRAGSAGVHLSPRQREVLPLLADGLTTAEIAAALGISPRTVRMHCDALKTKLGVTHRRQLLRVYRELIG